MTGRVGAKSPHEAFYFYNGTELHAVRAGPWKLHFPHPYLVVDGAPGKDGKPANFGKLKPQDLQKSGIAGVASRHGYRVVSVSTQPKTFTAGSSVHSFCSATAFRLGILPAVTM